MSNGTIYVCQRDHHCCEKNVTVEFGKKFCFCGAKIVSELHKSIERINDVSTHMIERRKRK